LVPKDKIPCDFSVNEAIPRYLSRLTQEIFVPNFSVTQFSIEQNQGWWRFCAIQIPFRYSKHYSSLQAYHETCHRAFKGA
jgi:hypothetical protein